MLKKEIIADFTYSEIKSISVTGKSKILICLADSESTHELININRFSMKHILRHLEDKRAVSDFKIEYVRASIKNFIETERSDIKKRIKESWLSIIIVLFLVVLLIVFLNTGDPETKVTQDDSPNSNELTRDSESIDYSSLSPKQIFNINQTNIKMYCKRAAEVFASYDTRWSDSLLDFPNFLPIVFRSERDTNAIVAVARNLELQNMFGAWAKSTIRCTYSPGKDAVIFTEIIIGGQEHEMNIQIGPY